MRRTVEFIIYIYTHRQRRQQHVRYTYCAFVDAYAKKAYDSVYHSAMFVGLWRQGVRAGPGVALATCVVQWFPAPSQARWRTQQPLLP